ncbi:BspA family leucine-rich repeat surface protein [Ruminococcus albus]|uniref:Surface protein n=1 Tax=Ruminococcus albus TaxID=1264 RepID=A0A1H7I700_RUMAL|nr:BspA family leucine-rich repeat surface protein [Ruminococcus albus]SEK57250.1 surface protein [Ruminococcus albus]
MQIKKVLAVVMSLCMAAGAVSYGAPVISQSITAQAADAESDCCTLDEKTGVLTLRGQVNASDVSKYGNTKKVKSVIAEERTVFPEDCGGLFKEFKVCTYMDLSKVDTSNVTNMNSMFDFCTELEHLDISGFDTSKVTNMCGMFSQCTNLTSLDVSGFDTSNVTNMAAMFRWCCNVKSLDVSGFDTSNVTDMGGMFSTCRELKSLDVTGFDTRKVTKMYDMFLACIGLTSLDVSSFDTSNVDNMSQMFSACNGLTKLDVSGFDTSNVEDMGNMFCNCPALTSLDLSNFDTRNVDNMHSMFGKCSGLTELDLSVFDTSKVKNMDFMFSGCSGLKTLDLSNFDTSNVYVGNFSFSRMTSMFDSCSELNTIILGEKYAIIPAVAKLPKGDGWVNTKSPSTIISGDEKFASIVNEGKNTYKQYAAITYPTNIKVAYSEKYHQVRFTWDKVDGADRYGIAVYLAGKWRIQTQNITDTTYTSPKNLTPGKTYKVAIAARVNGKWDTKNAIKNAVTVTIK